MQTAGENHAVRASTPAPAGHVSLIADPAELIARVPASGPLSEDDIILLAIANSPQLERRRAAIATARAEKRKEQDWEDPELRLSYGTQQDDYVRKPYTETTQVSLDTPLSDTLQYNETISHVIPGANGEEVTSELFNVQRDPDGNIISRTPTGTVYERTTSTSWDGADQEFAALLRFQIPHPWQRKAKIQRAAAEIMLAEAQYLSDEDRLVRDIRQLYQDLAVLESTLAAQQKRRRNFTTFRAEMEKDNIPEFTMDAARARLDMTRVFVDMSENQRDIEKARHELALLCGVNDLSRIRGGGRVVRRVIDVATLDPQYLVEMAMLYRSDMVESRGRLEIAKAHLAEANAAKIPFLSFVDAGYARQWRDHHSGEEDEWAFRVALNVPLWEWSGINKRSKEYKKAAAAWELQLEKQRQRVASEVDLAIARLRTVSASLRSYEGAVQREQRENQDILKKLSESATDIGDYARGKRARYDAEDQILQMEIGRSEAYSDYNKAIIALEDAIGVRIEKVLNGWRDK